MTHGPPNPQPPFPASKQPMPGDTKAMDPKPDYGEESYKGSGRLAGKAALITGGDSGIGRAVALAFAREGANVLISYLDEHEDAEEAASWVEKAGKRAVLVPGDVSQEEHCKELVARTVKEFGKIDILVNNAAFQATHESIEEISAEEWDHTFRTNIYAYFYLAKAAVGQMQPGGSIIATSSVNAKTPSPELLAYATTKGAIANFTAGLAQSVASKGIRVNCVGPGPGCRVPGALGTPGPGVPSRPQPLPMRPRACAGTSGSSVSSRRPQTPTGRNRSVPPSSASSRLPAMRHDRGPRPTQPTPNGQSRCVTNTACWEDRNGGVELYERWG